MESLITVLQVLASVLLVASILLQPAKSGGGLVLSSGNPGTSGSKDYHPLFKITFYLATFLLISSLGLSWFKINKRSSSVVDKLAIPSLEAGAESSTVPADITTTPAETTTTPKKK